MIYNSEERCIAGTSWCMDNSTSVHTRVTGVILTNNMAEKATMVMALLVWQSMHLHIHMDLQFVLDLVHGGLLAMEWVSHPVSHLHLPIHFCYPFYFSVHSPVSDSYTHVSGLLSMLQVPYISCVLVLDHSGLIMCYCFTVLAVHPSYHFIQSSVH